MKRLLFGAAVGCAGALTAGAQGRGAGGADTVDRNATFAVGTATAKRGETSYGELTVPPNGDAGTSLPVAIVNGAKRGPVVAFIAGSHGTEYASVVALSRLISRIDATKLSGTVVIMPLLNIASWEQMTVHVNPVDRKGMNGGYPGNPNGTQTERALDLVARQVVNRASIVVDLHGGDIDEDLRPYSYLIRTGNAAQDSAAKALVFAFGLDHIILRDIDPANPAAGRSLSGYSLVQGKTAIVAEAGRSGLVLDADVNALINGSLNVLGALKMLERPAKPVASPVYITAGTRVAADKGGMFFPSVARDSKVQKDQVVGYTTDYLGRKTADIKSPVTGLVSFIRTVPSMLPGATLVNVAEFIPTLPPYKKPQ